MSIRWIAALLMLAAGSVVANEPRKVHIQVDGDPKFEVLYHRALSNHIGGAIASYVGAGIQATVEAEKDAEKRAALRSHVAEQIWNDVFIKTLDDSFRAKGWQPVWVEGKSTPHDADVGADADVYLTLFPASYGFRVVDSSTALVAAYVELEAIYAREPLDPSKRAPKESFYMTSGKQSPYDDLPNQSAALNADVEAVLARAARRLASKIIYNVR